MSNALDWAGIISGPVGVALGACGKGIFDRKVRKSEGVRIDADAARVIAETAVTLVAPLKAEIKALNRRVDAYVDYIGELHVWIAARTNEIPPPPPIVLDI